MGGKSTLLRATCVAVVLAQMGAPVPAHSCVLSSADAVFARLGGAGDRIHAGESTFLVECAEASVILRSATRDSIVALDELGRGTSTFDGYAVAHASFEHLALDTRCRMMFATHYHAMSRDFGASPFVQLKHMAAHVADDVADDVTREATEADRPITFLYKLRRGACPKSYGMRVAALAGVPRTVVEEAEKAAASMEKKLSNAFGDESDAFTVGERSAVDAIVAATDAGDVDMLMKLQAAVRERRGIET
jgi:DNA mismatch repair protein MSH6